MKLMANDRSKMRRAREGLTLIELMVVVALIAMIAGLAIPKLLPTIIFTSHEGAARRLAGYGRAAIAHAAFTHRDITVKVDLDNQEYWAEQWPEPEPEGDAEVEDAEEENASPIELLERAQAELDEPRRAEVFRDEDEETAVDKQAQAMDEAFANAAQQELVTLAKRVVHDSRALPRDLLLPEEEDAKSRRRRDDIEPEPVSDPTLSRTRLNDNVLIESVIVGEKTITKGIVEIPVTPLGLESEVTFYLLNEDGDYFTVVWDPIQSDARLYRGLRKERT